MTRYVLAVQTSIRFVVVMAERKVVVMAERKVVVLCHWNGCIKYGSDGVNYEGTTLRKIKVNKKTELSRLVDGLCLITKLDKQISKFQVFGRYPVLVSPNLFTYVHLPVVDDTSLEKMLEVPSVHPSIKTVELYLDVKPASDIDTTVNPGSSLKRHRTDTPVKLERIEEEADAVVGNGRDGDMIGSGPHAELHLVVTGDGSNDLNKDSSSGVKKPCLSSLWLDDHDLRVGLCFKDGDELKKAVDWCCFKGQQKCLVRKNAKDECSFECIRWKCKWSVEAARMEKHGFFEITKYTGPHTCHLVEPKKSEFEFEAYEIERMVRVQPTLSAAELKQLWKEKFGYEFETLDMQEAKEEALKRIFGDWDRCYQDLPKLMSALHSSNGLLVEWKYDLAPNPKFASFCGVFGAFSQSIEGFQYCRPVIHVDSGNLDGELKLMFASGVDAADNQFPLAFAITKEVSTDSWRWFLSVISEKVTQRKGLCLISRPHPDILAVINEPDSLWKEPWAYHRFCLDHFCTQLYYMFQDNDLINLVEKAGSTSQEKEFDCYMKDIEKKNSEARKWLDQFHPNQWALAHDDGRSYGHVPRDTIYRYSVFDFDELVLTAWVLIMFDLLRDYFEDSFYRSLASLKRGNVYTEPVMKMLGEFMTSSVTHVVMPLHNNAFQVIAPSENVEEWIVQLSDCTCTCGKFQSRKFPCLHALAVCKKLKINPFQYVDDYYTVERYHKTYSAKFNPVPEFAAWPEASGVPTLFPPVIPPPPPPPPPPPTNV